jgi:hypothetical protein
MAPPVQLMCVATRATLEFRSAIRVYMEKVIGDMEKQISTAWFDLSASGIATLHDA